VTTRTGAGKRYVAGADERLLTDELGIACSGGGSPPVSGGSTVNVTVESLVQEDGSCASSVEVASW
jgi:hypothetical protein